MEKHEIDMSKYADMHEEVTVTGKDGTEVTVRSHIPYDEKENFARELAENTLMIHDDSCVYESHEARKWKLWLILKYYTDVDTDVMTQDEAADFMINNGLADKIEDEVLCDDLYEIWLIHNAIQSSFKSTFNDDRSIAKAVRTSFAFLFNGEDVTESLAKAEATKEVMYNAFSALQAKEKEEKTKIADGKVKVGGNLINFTRREI